MKVLYMDPQSYSNLALYDYNLLKNLPHETEIVFCGSSLYNQSIPKNVKFIPVFRYNKLQNNILKLLSYWLSLIRLFMLVCKVKPDVVHIQWIRCFVLDYLFLNLLKYKGIRIVYTAHNVLPHNSGNKYRNQFNKYYHKLDAIIVHSLISKNEMIDLFNIEESKIHVIRHGVLSYPVPQEKLQIRTEQLKKEIGIREQIVFAVIGSMSFYKGCDLVIELWKKNVILQDDNKYKMLFVGKNQGMNFSDIRHITNVHIVDAYVDDESLLAYLALTDVLLLPYRKISQSGVLLTAVAQRIPFIVTNAGGISEPFSVADVGWNMGDASLENLNKCVMNLIHSSEEIRLKKDNVEGWDRLQQLYSWNNIALETYNLYVLMTE